jgi:nitrogen fixation NifU-like protein
MYSDKAMEHFRNPKNMGEMKDADGVGKVGNVYCGDVMWVFIKIEKNSKNQEIITDAKFQTFGCVAAISTSDMVTELVKGKPLDYALKISKDDIVKALGGLPPIKVHCSVLANDALAEAVYDYYKKTDQEIPGSLEERHEKLMKDMRTIEKRHKEGSVPGHH